MSKSKWEESKEFYIAYSILIDAAQHRGFATYQEIAQAIGLPTSGNYMSREIGDILGIISTNEVRQGRPMLSAVATGSTGKLGGGFITVAKELGVFKEGEDEDAFWEAERGKVYKAWKISYRESLTKAG